MAANKKAERKLYPIFVDATDKADTERYFGTPAGPALVQTRKRVEVPFNIKEGFDLAKMQQRAIDKYIKSHSIDDNPDDIHF